LTCSPDLNSVRKCHTDIDHRFQNSSWVIWFTRTFLFIGVFFFFWQQHLLQRIMN